MAQRYAFRITLRKWRDPDQTLRSLLEHLRYAGVLSYDNSLEEVLVVDLALAGPRRWLDQVCARIKSFGDRAAVLKARHPLLGQSTIHEVREKSREAGE